MSDSAEELHSQLVTSDYPIWDYVDFRKKHLLQKGSRISPTEKIELGRLIEIDDSLWSGKFLGGDHPAKMYFCLQVDKSEVLKKTWDSLKDIIRREEEVQRNQPGRCYLKWVQARCLRETRCWVRRQREEFVRTFPSQRYPTTQAQIDETLQQIPVDDLVRVSDSNNPAHQFCRGHRMRLKATKDKRYKPEIDHLDKLLKIRHLWFRERPTYLFRRGSGLKIGFSN